MLCLPSLNKSSLEAYSRDIQAYPLRVLEEMFRSIRLGGFCPDNTRSGIIQKLKEPDVREPPYAFGSTGGAGRKPSVVSATAVVAEEDGPLDDEIRQWLVLSNGSEQREEECKGLALSESTGEVEVQSKVGNDKQESREGERHGISELSSDSSSSSSEDSGTSDDELLMRGGSDHAGVVEWKQGTNIARRRPCICCLLDHKNFSSVDAKLVRKHLLFVVASKQLSGDASNAIEESLSDMLRGWWMHSMLHSNE